MAFSGSIVHDREFQFTFDGKLKDLIRKLQYIYDTSTKEIQDKLEYEFDADGQISFEIYFHRPESDMEMRQREAREQNEKENGEARERQLYERLKRKFEPELPPTEDARASQWAMGSKILPIDDEAR